MRDDDDLRGETNKKSIILNETQTMPYTHCIQNFVLRVVHDYCGGRGTFQHGANIAPLKHERTFCSRFSDKSGNFT
jgi:hypothetical protein